MANAPRVVTTVQEPVVTQTITGVDAVMTDQLNLPPFNPGTVVLFYNGVQMVQGAVQDYQLQGIGDTQILWLAGTGTAPNQVGSGRLIAYYRT